MSKLSRRIDIEDINVKVAIFYMLFLIGIILLLILYFSILKK